MKRLVSVCLMVLLVVGMTLSVNAAGVFIISPSNNTAPVLQEYYNENGEKIGTLYITSYGDRNVLELVDREIFEGAYNSISNSTNVSALNSDIAGIAANLNISVDNLGISDLFYLSMEDYLNNGNDGHFTIKLQSDALDHFVGLMYYEDGKWYVVEDAVVSGDSLTFTSDVPRALAVVVDVDNSVIDVPVTGDFLPWVLMGVMLLSAIGIVAVALSFRKKSRA